MGAAKATVGETIRRHRASITRRWSESARGVALSRGLPKPDLLDVLPAYLSLLADRPDDAARQREEIVRHVARRLQQGFDLVEVQTELELLRRAVARHWESLAPDDRPERSDVDRFDDNLHRASLAAAECFQAHLRLDEQKERHYLRLLQGITDEALRKPEVPLRVRLSEIARVIMEAMVAQTAAILLFRRDDGRRFASGAAGIAEDEMEHYATSLASPSSLASTIARSAEPTAVQDAETTEIEVGERLRHSGIRSLLGVRLPPQKVLLGVLYVGLVDERAFGEREKRRLEGLGGLVTQLLENALLFSEVRRCEREFAEERAVRDRFVAIVAHDLRGPLSTAKLLAHELVGERIQGEARRDFAARIERNLERMDRMVRDLLDVNRVRAGQPLPLHLGAADLAQIAREVVEELRVTWGDRVRLEAGERLCGTWSAEELRRAIWNLVANAAKYGASDQPVTVRVERSAMGARVSVHNWGTAIPSTVRERLFEPFVRPVGSDRSSGWGLGLALVKACAEAHRGRVTVESSDGAGTTFAIDLPLDARADRAVEEEAAAPAPA